MSDGRARRWLSRLLVWPLRLARIEILVLPYRFIGHLAKEPDYWLKEQILGTRPRRRGLLLAPSDEVANRVLAGYWSRYVRVVRRPLLCRLLNSLAVRGGLAADTEAYVRNLDPERMTVGPGRYAEVAAAWGQRPPLLRLTGEHRRRGWDTLRSLGLPDGAWFVCVQNRTPEFYQQFSHWFTESGGERRYDTSLRDCSIRGFIPAMEALAEAGGWCIRVGDPGTEPLPPVPHAIDYAHSDAKSEWMDVFLCASCRFYLGCNSGLSVVPTVFGVPAVRTNAAPLSAVNAFRPGDIAIPKLVRRGDRILSFPEVLSSDIGSYFLDHAFARDGLTLVENDPDDIRGCALEMLATLDGTIEYTREDERLQHAFRCLIEPHHYSYGGVARVGRDFLRRYSSLLEGERQPAGGSRER